MERVNVDRTWRQQSSIHGASTQGQAGERKRAAVACRRCRRLRSKCMHQGAKPPCEPCRKAGNAAASTCVFLTRGTKDYDREYRRKRQANSARDGPSTMVDTLARPHVADIEETTTQYGGIGSPVNLSHKPPVTSQSRQELWQAMPPFEEVFEACKAFTTSCFQISFIPRAFFLEKLSTNRESFGGFFLYSMLSVSSRYSPSLKKRYGSASKATEYFLSRASELIPNEVYSPSLERIQAFFLLGNAEWIQGDRVRSAMHLGIAVRMAGIYHLHREETFALPKDPTVEDMINLEVARRTFWCLQTQDRLHAGQNSAAAISLCDITTLLPCDENEFSFGILPSKRAALPGTQIALRYPELCYPPERGLFATLVEVHNMWGEVARKAGRAMRSEREKADDVIKPWESTSSYAQLTQTLREWEDTLPPRHRWSLWNLRGYKGESYDMTYLSVIVVSRLNNIVVRRIYMADILESMCRPTTKEGPNSKFWSQMAQELYENIDTLYNIIDTFRSLQQPEDGFPAIHVFSIYVCGSLASYLRKWPQLCPQLAGRADTILEGSLRVLDALTERIPLASRWHSALCKVVNPQPAQHNMTRPQQASQSNAHRRSPYILPAVSYPSMAIPAMGALPGVHEMIAMPPMSSEGMAIGSPNTSNLQLLSHYALNESRNYASQIPPIVEPGNQFIAGGQVMYPKVSDNTIVGNIEFGMGGGINPNVGMSDIDFYTGYSFEEDFLQILEEDVRLEL